jgi:membrane protein
MKSRVVAVSPFVKRIRLLSETLREDRITVYGAQTAFYICISAIPFVMLLILLSRLVSPELVPRISSALRGVLPHEGEEIVDFIFFEAARGADIPLISTAAATALWSASRGMRAVMKGVSEVYGVALEGGFIYSVILSVIYTALFVGILTVTIVFFAFGGTSFFIKYFGGFTFLFRFKSVLFGAFLGVYFALLYFVVTKGAFFFSSKRTVSNLCPKRFREQLPGAFLAAAGWLLFSYFYSLYIRFFPRSSYVYGSLGAVVFLMLWLYFCIVIILLGAEINKMVYLRKK